MTDYIQEQARYLGQLEASIISAQAYIQINALAKVRAELERAVAAIRARDNAFVAWLTKRE